MLKREKSLFETRNPKSRALSDQAAHHWLRGVPMHWMVDWGTPFPLFVNTATGVELTDADGNSYIDFCLGDTGAMFGHSPKLIADVLAKAGATGLTTMLPSPDAVSVGELLADRFALPFWQVTATASDANRAVLRWARAVTGRSKILIFNHAYHGCVDETFVTADAGVTAMVQGLVGEPRDLTSLTTVVEFNDVSALERALAAHDVACVLAEPVMTNVGMVLPDPGFLETLRALTKKTGTLLVFDETHTLSSGPGGYARKAGIAPDGLVFGKPIAAGIPAAAYGFSEDVAARIKTFLASRGSGRSGIGTTLSGSRIQLALIRCVLEHFMTPAAFAPVLALAEKLEAGIAGVIKRHSLDWHVTRVGARVEFMCCRNRPRNGFEASKLVHRPIDDAIHHYLLNRGIVITPFHNMMLVCPSTTPDHITQLVASLDSCVAALENQEI
jgi:glutamate-1-semialdehyde 2,1-aminomutase